jgi:hypothetical protein
VTLHQEVDIRICVSICIEVVLELDLVWRLLRGVRLGDEVSSLFFHLRTNAVVELLDQVEVVLTNEDRILRQVHSFIGFHYMRCNNCDFLPKISPGVFSRQKNGIDVQDAKKENMKGHFCGPPYLRSLQETSVTSALSTG